MKYQHRTWTRCGKFSIVNGKKCEKLIIKTVLAELHSILFAKGRQARFFYVNGLGITDEKYFQDMEIVET